MTGWGMWLFRLVVLLALNVIAKMMAQKLYPTFPSDSFGRRFRYHVVFVFSILVIFGIVVLILFALDSAGYRP